MRFTSAGEFLVPPDNCWDLVFIRRRDRIVALRTGLTTRPDVVTYGPGDEILTLSFLPSTYMPSMPGDAMRDEGVILETFGPRDVWIGRAVREIPTFENAESFVERLARDGIIESNDVVGSIVRGQPKALSERTMQRHFLRTTGLTYKHFTMIERAHQAVALIRQGGAAAEIASATGFSDQAHMTNSLKRIMGKTPGEIVRTLTG